MRNFTCILLSERSHSEKSTYCVMATIDNLEKAKPQKQDKDQWLLGIQVKRDKQRQHRELKG